MRLVTTHTGSQHSCAATSGFVGVDGLTGALTIDGHGHVQRGLEFARVAGGKPQPAGPAGQLSLLPEPATNPDGSTLPH